MTRRVGRRDIQLAPGCRGRARRIIDWVLA